MNPTIAYVIDLLRPEYTEGEARELAYCLVEHLSGLSRTELLLRPTPVELYGVEGYLNRLLQHEPVEYLLGQGEWMGLPLRLTPNTLIPRPETAELVEWILHDEPSASLRVLDIGTGSGCIALALKQKRPQWMVEGLDVNEDAVDVARSNAETNGLDVDFFVHDILRPDWDKGDYDIWVSNPPYVTLSERTAMDKNVLCYEPSRALFVPDDDPLVFYHAIVRKRAARTIYFEINEQQGQAMVQLMRDEGYRDICLKQDSYGKDRMLRARLCV